jgi:hypothetical protein
MCKGWGLQWPKATTNVWLTGREIRMVTGTSICHSLQVLQIQLDHKKTGWWECEDKSGK